ncbi:molybdopterin-dependent oxidoreductase [Roseovarius sp. MMSF_3281]|uniref:molybdopterin-dependent oxidoreductase n=1 Tax=Roseovarius sp. MMSF_3281 TaxID=3046694 RepID=UPI00273E1559|nr:molybdopterin-dependent oxidoreductase [Roseovarius sp. MMSF_3281]
MLAWLCPHQAQAEQEDPLFTLVQPLSGGPGTLTTKITRAHLMSLPLSGFETKTVWTQGQQRFDGVWLADLLAEFGITEGTLTVQAINDYWVQIPVSEVNRGGALLALMRNDQPMTVREKGPVWLIYNYDSDPAFRTEMIYTRSVWQLDRITVSR